MPVAAGRLEHDWIFKAYQNPIVLLDADMLTLKALCLLLLSSNTAQDPAQM